MMVIFMLGMIATLLTWVMIGYYLGMMNKYRKLANIERKKLEKLGIYIEEPPMM